MFVFVFMFVFFFMWASCLLLFFVFVWSRSQMDEWVSWLPKPILVLLEGGAA